jgi:predicted phage tail protein
MAKKLNSDINVVSDRSFYQSDKGLDGKGKKPLLERLGLIEPIIKSTDKEEEFKMLDEVAVTTDIKSGGESNSYANNVDRLEKTLQKLSIKEIFDKFGLEARETNTVYLIDSFIKALPDNLPADIKRQSIINLISASQLDISSLLKDGSKRMETLNKYYQDFENNVSEIIASNEKQIRMLNERIAYHNRIIEEKQKMMEMQKAEIDFELQKISNIIEFIENKTK